MNKDNSLSRRKFLSEIVSKAGVVGGIGLLPSCIGIWSHINGVKQRIETVTYNDDNNKQKDLTFGIWYPTPKYDEVNNLNSKLPLIGFSHGFGGSPWVYETLLSEMSLAGNVVVAPQHHDLYNLLTTNGIIQFNLEELKEQIDYIIEELRNITGYENATLDDVINHIFCEDILTGIIRDGGFIQDFRDFFKPRVKEIDVAMDTARIMNINPDSYIFGKIDSEKTGISGHSLGGSVVIEKINPDGELYDSKINAALLLSPASGFYDASSVLIPTRFITGTLDDEVFRDSFYKSFQQVTGPSSFINFRNVGHLSFANEACALLDTFRIFFKSGEKSLNIKYTVHNKSKEKQVKLFTEDDLAAVENHEEKTAAICNASNCFMGYWIKKQGSEDAFLNNYSYMVDAYEKRN